MYIPRMAASSIKKSLDDSKIILLLGARQVGKTTLVEKIISDRKTILLNFDIESDKQRFLSIAQMPPEEALNSLTKPEILIIDEAQRIAKTSQIVKGWYDIHLPIKIILLGSSSLNLLNQSAESLTGRNEKVFLPPLVFEEILAIQSWYSSALNNEQLLEYFSKQIEALLLENLFLGSYPAVVISSEKSKVVTNLVSDYLLKDIFNLDLVKTGEPVWRLLAMLAHQVGSEVSINELATNLAMARPTVEKYLNLLEKTFVIFRLPAYSSNLRKEISKSQKIYFWDTGIRNAILNDFSQNPLRSDIGALWENWVIAEFAKQNLLTGQRKNLYFWRSKAGSEVGLIIKEGQNIKAHEIKWQKKSAKNRAFEARYKIKVGLINKSNPIFRL